MNSGTDNYGAGRDVYDASNFEVFPTETNLSEHQVREPSVGSKFADRAEHEKQDSLLQEDELWDAPDRFPPSRIKLIEQDDRSLIGFGKAVGTATTHYVDFRFCVPSKNMPLKITAGPLEDGCSLFLNKTKRTTIDNCMWTGTCTSKRNGTHTLEVPKEHPRYSTGIYWITIHNDGVPLKCDVVVYMQQSRSRQMPSRYEFTSNAKASYQQLWSSLRDLETKRKELRGGSHTLQVAKLPSKPSLNGGSTMQTSKTVSHPPHRDDIRPSSALSRDLRLDQPSSRARSLVRPRSAQARAFSEGCNFSPVHVESAQLRGVVYKRTETQPETLVRRPASAQPRTPVSESDKLARNHPERKGTQPAVSVRPASAQPKSSSGAESESGILARPRPQSAQPKQSRPFGSSLLVSNVYAVQGRNTSSSRLSNCPIPTGRRVPAAKVGDAVPKDNNRGQQDPAIEKRVILSEAKKSYQGGSKARARPASALARMITETEASRWCQPNIVPATVCEAMTAAKQLEMMAAAMPQNSKPPPVARTLSRSSIMARQGSFLVRQQSFNSRRSPTVTFDREEEDSVVVPGDKLGQMLSDLETAERERTQLPQADLFVLVSKAKHLTTCDGECEAYMQLRVEDPFRGTVAEHTTPVMSSSHPDWNTSFKLDCRNLDQDAYLRLTCMHRPGRNVFPKVDHKVGETTVPIRGLPRFKMISRWFTLSLNAHEHNTASSQSSPTVNHPDCNASSPSITSPHLREQSPSPDRSNRRTCEESARENSFPSNNDKSEGHVHHQPHADHGVKDARSSELNQGPPREGHNHSFSLHDSQHRLSLHAKPQGEGSTNTGDENTLKFVTDHHNSGDHHQTPRTANRDSWSPERRNSLSPGRRSPVRRNSLSPGRRNSPSPGRRGNLSPPPGARGSLSRGSLSRDIVQRDSRVELKVFYGDEQSFKGFQAEHVQQKLNLPPTHSKLRRGSSSRILPVNNISFSAEPNAKDGRSPWAFLREHFVKSGTDTSTGPSTESGKGKKSLSSAAKSVIKLLRLTMPSPQDHSRSPSPPKQGSLASKVLALRGSKKTFAWPMLPTGEGVRNTEPQEVLDAKFENLGISADFFSAWRQPHTHHQSDSANNPTVSPPPLANQPLTSFEAAPQTARLIRRRSLISTDVPIYTPGTAASPVERFRIRFDATLNDMDSRPHPPAASVQENRKLLPSPVEAPEKKTLAGMEQLCLNEKTLNLSGVPKINDEFLEYLSLHRGPELRELVLAGCKLPQLPAVLTVVARYHMISAVDLSECEQVTDEWLDSISIELQLKRLVVARCIQLTNRGLIAAAQHSPTLMELDCQGCALVGDDACMAVVKGCHQLRKVCLRGCMGIGAVGAGSLASATLTDVNLSGLRNVSSQALQSLAGGCPSLRRLNIGMCKGVNDTSLAIIATKCPKLTSLILHSSADLTDSGVINLAKRLGRLEELSLSHCQRVSDFGVFKLAICCTGLKRLWLDGLAQLSDKSITTLADRCEQLEVVSLRGCSNITSISVGALTWTCENLLSLDLAGSGVSEEVLQKALDKTVGMREQEAQAKKLEWLCGGRGEAEKLGITESVLPTSVRPEVDFGTLKESVCNAHLVGFRADRDLSVSQMRVLLKEAGATDVDS